MSVRVAYILAQYPCRSERFIEREVRAVRRQGVAVDAFAIRVGEGSEPAGGATYRDGVPLAEKLAALLWAARRPLKFARALSGIFREGAGCPGRLLRSLRNVPVSMAWARRIQRNATTHLHGHFLGEPAIIARTISILITIPYSLSVHARDIFVDMPAASGTIRNAAAVAACTLAGAERARELLPDDRHAKVHVIRHGLELPAGNAARSAQGFPIVLAVGRLVEKKGIPVLLGALKRMPAQRRVECVVVGDGPDRGAIERRAGELGIADSLQITGWQSPQEVAAWMQRADVLAVPSIVAADGDRDGLPNVILEAAIAGLPVAAADTGGIGEFVVNEQTGMLVDAGDEAALAAAIGRLIDDTALRDAVVENARAKVRREYDADRKAEALIEAMGWKA